MSDFPLEDPFAEVRSKVDEAVRKGLMARRTGDKLVDIDQWVDDNRGKLRRRFPGKVVTVVKEGARFLTYAGDDVLAAHNLAKNFSPSEPTYTLAFQPTPLIRLGGGTESPKGQSFKERILQLEKEKQDEDGSGKGEEGGQEEEPTGAFDAAVALKEEVVNAAPELFAPQNEGGSVYVAGFLIDADGNNVVKYWHFDGGASFSTVSTQNLKQIASEGGKFGIDGFIEATLGVGQAKFPKVTGLTMAYSHTNTDGDLELVTCGEDLGWGDSDIIGNDQRKVTRTNFTQDVDGEHKIFEKPPAEGGGGSGSGSGSGSGGGSGSDSHSD
ncbi:MAG TPA: hypothetical protein VLV83_22990 [Acidobacteriota bacterium]|nr:hypothetical protein [Acidobacteriota bacterium]